MKVEKAPEIEKRKLKTWEEIKKEAKMVGEERIERIKAITEKLKFLLAPDTLLKGIVQSVMERFQLKKEEVSERIKNLLEGTKERAKLAKEKMDRRIEESRERLNDRFRSIKKRIEEKGLELAERAVDWGISKADEVEYLARRIRITPSMMIEEMRKKALEKKIAEKEEMIKRLTEEVEESHRRLNEVRTSIARKQEELSDKGRVRRAIESLGAI
jgi:hypothetical protein